MMCIVNVVKLTVLSVNRQCILGQVICSDTEEVYLFCQKITDHHCCRCLDHDTLFNFTILDSFFCQFCLDRLYDLLDLFYFIYRDDHRVHNSYVTICACTEKCAKLCTEDISSVQADTDRTVSHSWVLFMVKVEVIYLLVCTDIQCTHDYFLSCHVLCNRLVCLELCFFIRIVICFQI